MPVPAPAATGFGDDDALARRVKVREQDAVLGVVHKRSRWDRDDEMLAGFPRHFFSHARFAARGFPMVPAHEIKERVFVGIGDEDDVAAVAAVTAVRSALGDVFFATE